MKYTDYVNVFQGNGEINLPEPQGIASKWFFLKAQCGNTFPHASYPFGKMSCGCYSGGYPTGYGNHMPNYCGGVPRFSKRNMIKGFSHIHQSGTGAIGMYYNYAVVTPMYGELRSICEAAENETARPGYYGVTYGESGIRAEATVTDKAAVHRYTLNGRAVISVDFSNNGLNREFGEHFFRVSPYAEVTCGEDLLSAQIEHNGIMMYMAVRCEGDICGTYIWKNYTKADGAKKVFKGEKERFGAAFEVNGGCIVKAAVSMKSMECALAQLEECCGFDEAAAQTEAAWERVLCAVKLDADERSKRIFYSNLYHSFLKPCDWSGESFMYEDNTFYSEFATMWDLYKTQLPLVFTLFGKTGRGIIKTFESLGRKLGYLPVNLTLTRQTDVENQQARMLMEYSAADAYYRGIEGDYAEFVKIAYADLHSPLSPDFAKNGKCARYTHILDMADACAAMRETAVKLGLEEEAREFERCEDFWRNGFDEKTGLMSAESPYYEGDLWNYSFRLMKHMDERIRLCGGDDEFVRLADRFFGYGAPDVRQAELPNDTEYVDNMQLHRFEGFNNEPDMETPYCYIYAGRHDRTCETVRAGLEYMFTEGCGGIPGNNDSGGLSSCYVWNMLGIFPVTGQNIMLIGSPGANGAELKLNNGNVFTVKAVNNSRENIYVEKAVLNGRTLDGFSFSVTEMMKGGVLELYMTSDSSSGRNKKL